MALQVAQFFGVGGGHIDRREIDVAARGFHHAGEILGPVGAGPCWRPGSGPRGCLRVGRKAGADGLRALVVKAEAVDRGAVFGQPEQARFGVARLRQGRCGTDFNEPKARA